MPEFFFFRILQPFPLHTILALRIKKDISPQKKAKRVLLRIAFGVLGLLVLCIAIIAIAMNTVVTLPKRITPILLGLSKEYIKGDVHCESINITFFSTFPELGVKLQNRGISSERDTIELFDVWV